MRVEGWESALVAHIEQVYKNTFAWGEYDCATWCAEWILRSTGRDFLSDWKGRYSTEEGAQSLMAERGYADASEIADAHLTVVPIMLARRGDLLLHASGTLGICAGLKGIFPTTEGVIAAKTSSCLRAWRVE